MMKKLLSVNFEGSEALFRQLSNCTVKTLDSEGSLKFRLDAACARANVKMRVPVEGEYSDLEEDGMEPESGTMGMKVRLLVHVIDGFLSELEIYKDDGQPIRRLPRAEDLVIEL